VAPKRDFTVDFDMWQRYLVIGMTCASDVECSGKDRGIMRTRTALAVGVCGRIEVILKCARGAFVWIQQLTIVWWSLEVVSFQENRRGDVVERKDAPINDQAGE
jgi:hypothetical protein